MNTDKRTTEMKVGKAILSTLWVFVMFNYLYADFVSLIFNPAYQTMATRMTEGLVLGAAVVFEISIAMVLLSRVLKYRANRWAKILVGLESTAFVAFTLFGGNSPAPYYLFFAPIEIACTLFIVWYALKWPNSEGQAHNIALDHGEFGGNS